VNHDVLGGRTSGEWLGDHAYEDMQQYQRSPLGQLDGRVGDAMRTLAAPPTVTNQQRRELSDATTPMPPGAPTVENLHHETTPDGADVCR
jgi:hypothetical protein